MAIKLWWAICMAIMSYLAISPVSMLEIITEFEKVPKPQNTSSVGKNISGGN